MPLLEAHKLSSRAAQVGFDWPNIDGLFDKLQEETDELREVRLSPLPRLPTIEAKAEETLDRLRK